MIVGVNNLTSPALPRWPHLITNDSVHDGLIEEHTVPWCLHWYHSFTVFQEIQQYNNILHNVSFSDADSLVCILCPSSLVKLKHICIKYNFKKKSLSHTCIRSYQEAKFIYCTYTAGNTTFHICYLSKQLETKSDKWGALRIQFLLLSSENILKHRRNRSRGCP